MRRLPEQRMAGSDKPGAPAEAEFTIPLTSDSLHDLVSPLNQVSSLSDLILRKCQGTLNSDTEVLFGLLRTATNRLQSLVNGLRIYAQVAGSASAYQLSKVEELLSAALMIVKQSLGPHDARITHDALPELWCNPAQITYALSGLIENAIKFRGEAPPEIHIGARPTKTNWVLSVRDNGIGIDPRYFNRIFATFKRLHNDAYPGSGVGLAITKHVVEQHRGRIWVESAPGEGATFFIALPMASSREAAKGAG